MAKKFKLSPIARKGDSVADGIRHTEKTSEEIGKDIERTREIEQQITNLCGEWCQLNNKEEMDVLYLKDRVIFGEL